MYVLSLDRGAFPLRTGIVAVAALLLLGVAMPGWASPPTQSECEQRWSWSSADDTCSDESISVSGSKCRISAQCERAWPYPARNASITVWLDQVSRLLNCDGNLYVAGAC